MEKPTDFEEYQKWARALRNRLLVRMTKKPNVSSDEYINIFQNPLETQGMLVNLVEAEGGKVLDLYWVFDMPWKGNGDIILIVELPPKSSFENIKLSLSRQNILEVGQVSLIRSSYDMKWTGISKSSSE